MNTDRRSHRKVVVLLSIAALMTFGLGYALVPLYNVFCEVAGLNGRSSTLLTESASGVEVDRSRTVTVEFVATRNAELPWEFGPNERKMEVHPGALMQTTYHARNVSDHRIVGQAVPSVAPSRAAAALKKVECFCFTQQPLEPGESKDLPVYFYVDPDLDPEITTLTLSYTVFDAERRGGPAAKSSDDGAHQHAHHGAGADPS